MCTEDQVFDLSRKLGVTDAELFIRAYRSYCTTRRSVESDFHEFGQRGEVPYYVHDFYEFHTVRRNPTWGHSPMRR